MTGSDLFREIGNISEEYVVEAENYRKQSTGAFHILKNPSFRKTLVTAACLVICVGLVFTVQKLGVRMDSAAESAMEGNKTGFEMAAAEAPAAQEVAASSEASVEDVAAEAEEEAAPENAPVMEESMDPETAPENEEGVVGSTPENVSGSASSAEKDEICNYPAVSGEEKKESVKESAGWDSEATRERLAEYPDDYKILLTQDNAFIISHGNIKAGQQVWDDFRKHVDAGEPTQIDIIRFTVEGDAIIEVVYYDGELFHLLVDNSRDAYRGSGDAYYEATYENMLQSVQKFEDGTKSVEYMLTNSKSESYSIVYIVE